MCCVLYSLFVKLDVWQWLSIIFPWRLYTSLSVDRLTTQSHRDKPCEWNFGPNWDKKKMKCKRISISFLNKFLFRIEWKYAPLPSQLTQLNWSCISWQRKRNDTLLVCQILKCGCKRHIFRNIHWEQDRAQL